MEGEIELFISYIFISEKISPTNKRLKLLLIICSLILLSRMVTKLFFFFPADEMHLANKPKFILKKTKNNCVESG